MNQFSRSSQLLSGVVLLGSLAIAGCGSNQSAPPQTTAPAPVATAPAPAPAATTPTAPAPPPAPAPAPQTAAAPAQGRPRIAGYCFVSDPTGTPLNVRDQPNGKVIATYPNQSQVTVNEVSADGKWAEVAPASMQDPTPRGWVFADYLADTSAQTCRCKSPSDPGCS